MTNLDDLDKKIHSFIPDYDETPQSGIRSRLDDKLVEIRSYHINWESYHQGQMIPTADYQFISRYDRHTNDEKDAMFEKQPQQCIQTMLSLINHVAKDHVIEYTLTIMDDILTKSRDRVKLFHEVALQQNYNIWTPLVAMLNNRGHVVMHMASRLIAKLATFSKVRCPEANIVFYLTWLKEQLILKGNDYIQSAAQCIHLVMRIDEYRMPFVKVDGINSIVSVLLSSLGFQLQYQLIFSLWLLAFNEEIAGHIGENNVIPVLADILRNSQKEKVTRIIMATFRNLLEKPEDSKMACVSIIQSKLLPTFSVLSKKAWDDDDIKQDIEYITERLNDSVQDMSTWDEYVAEVKSGRLEWSPVHRQEKFWRENAINICDKNYELLKLLVKLLQFSPDPQIQAIACHDLGEFIRHYPRAKPAFDTLGCKELIMARMAHEDPNVKYEALLAVQKLVQNWQFLGKEIKVE